MSLEDRFDDFLTEYRSDRGADRQFQGQIQQALETQGQRINDHGTRLRELERWRNYIAGGIAGIGVLLGLKMKGD